MPNKTSKKLLSAALALLLVFGSMILGNRLPVTSAAAKGAENIAAVAASQVGYYEETNGYTKYGDAFGDPTMEWACAFVAWCAHEAGIANSVVPAFTSCTAMLSFFKASGRYSTSMAHGTSYKPAVGDIVFFSSSNATNNVTHIGIVESATDTVITTIEGNNPNRVRRLTYTYSNQYVIGFATPAYTNERYEPAEAAANTPGTYRTNDATNLRVSYSESATFLVTIPAGTVVTVDAVNSNRWGHTTYNGQQGWFVLDYSTQLSSGSEQTEIVTSEYKKGTYQTTDALNFRSVPNGTVLSVIPENTYLDVTGVSGSWGQTKYNNVSGWISLEYAEYLPNTILSDSYKTGKYRTNEIMNFRSSPAGTLIATIPAGTVLTITEVNGVWGKTVYGGAAGWLSLEYSTYFTTDNDEPVTIIIPGSTTTIVTPADPGYPTTPVNWLVADISKWNATYDCNFPAMKAAGLEGVIIRIGGRGYGGSRVTYSDDAFYQHYLAAKQAGLHVGVYFFSYALSKAEAIEEAQLTINLLRAYNCDLDMPVFIDMEDFAEGSETDLQHWYAGRAVCTTVVDTFCTVVEQAGYYAGLYSGKSFIEDLIDTSVMNGRAMWVAHYASACGYTGRVDMWQYTPYGSISGYSGSYIDLNRCYVNFPAIIKGSGGTPGHTDIIVTPSTEVIVDPTHSEPNSTPAGGTDPEKPTDPNVDPHPSVVREWVTTKEATCLTDGEQCLYQDGKLLLKQITQAKHTKKVNCALKNSTVTVHAGDMIDPGEFSSNFYTETSPYYANMLNTIRANGGCKFTYCVDCGEILSVEYVYKSNNCVHSFADTVQKTATCRQEGLNLSVCEKCGVTGSETIVERAEHVVGDSEFIAATAASEACNCIKCRTCGALIYASYNILRGDVDGDNAVTAADARLVLRYAVNLEKLSAQALQNADVTEDKIVDVADARKILRISIRLE